MGYTIFYMYPVKREIYTADFKVAMLWTYSTATLKSLNTELVAYRLP